MNPRCPEEWYNADIEAIREKEFPMLRDTTYLDHAGTTLYSKSSIEAFSKEMTSNLFGNPHSASASSQLSTRHIEDTRLRVLRLFHADPDDFDVVFVANATAGIKLVAEAFRDQGGEEEEEEEEGFWYGYHADAHTSVVGVRELARKGYTCFGSDEEVESWMMSESGTSWPDRGQQGAPGLFAYPAQSNMTGRRLPLRWSKDVRSLSGEGRAYYSLLDAASLLSTSPLDLSDATSAPDFTVLSFYKIFGFPDLGALVIRKAAGDILKRRKYFGGGTVDMVIPRDEQWHAKKDSSLHAHLEDGTPPFHNIVALNSALDRHRELFESLEKVSKHTAYLAQDLFDKLSSLRHANGTYACELYSMRLCPDTDRTQGPIVALNLKDAKGEWIGSSEVEKLAVVKKIQLRTGGLCNPGGIVSHLKLSSSEVKSNFAAGQRCGDDNDLMNGKPTGAIRVSLGAMSSRQDVEAFLNFLMEFFVVKDVESHIDIPFPSDLSARFFVESLAVYPIKSCGAWKVPAGMSWKVYDEGLAWDREWCLVHQGTGVALSQKRYPRMALLRPTIDLERGLLRVRNDATDPGGKEIAVSLSTNGEDFVDAELCSTYSSKPSRVCGDKITAQVYNSAEIATFFTQALDVPCTLARFPPKSFLRQAKAHLQNHQQDSHPQSMPGTFPVPNPNTSPRPILLSNESPILLVSRSSVNRVNEQIKHGGGKAVYADAFRANIVVAEERPSPSQDEHPYVEDAWDQITIGQSRFQILGSCRRCQMVCVDHLTANKSDEPFSTLAKTRRFDGKVFFGQHLALETSDETEGVASIRIGDVVCTR